MHSTQRPIPAWLGSLMDPPRKARPRGILECRSQIDSGFSKLESILTQAADLLARPPRLVDKNCLSCFFYTGPTPRPLGLDARHYTTKLSA